MTAEKKRSLRERALHAGIWSTVMAVGGTGLRFVSSLITTRLLVPEVFGVVALALAMYAIISLLSDVGLRQSVIYHERGEDQEFLDTVWSVSALRGVFITLISGFCALAIAMAADSGAFSVESVYSNPQLPGVLAGTALSALWMGIKSPKLYLLERRLDFRKLSYIEAVTQVVVTIATWVLAYYWRSVWAIVIGSHIGVWTNTILSHYWISGPTGRFRWNREIVRDLVSYGKWILLSSTAFVIAANADRLLLGIWLGPALLGYYMLAWNIVSAFEGIATRPFVAVGMPAFSEIARRGDGQLLGAYRRFRLPLDLVTVGAAGFLFASGQLAVDVLYDSRYADAGRVLQILSFTLLFPRYATAATVHAALGRPQTGSWVNIARMVSVFVFIPAGWALGGYEGALWAIPLHMIPGVLVTFWKNHEFGLNDFGFELKMLAAWPAGFAAGHLAVLAGKPVLNAIGLL